MGNSIFDDDDEDFTLSGGIEGEQPKRPEIKPVTNNIPPRPVTNRRSGVTPPAGIVRPNPVVPPRATRPQVSPSLPKTPVQQMTTKPSTAMPPTRRISPSLPAAPSLPITPPAVYAKPEERITETVLPLPPVEVTKNDISYTENAEEVIHENYRTPVDYEAEEREARRAERMAAERAEERRLERQREQERLDRLREEREERERRFNQEAEKAPEANSSPQKVLSRKETAALKREEAKQAREASKNKGKGATKNGKPVSKYSGGRNQVLILRVIVFSVLAIFVFAGLKATFVPYKGPTANQVVETAKFGMGITKFPTDQGSAFVVGFSKIYLTVQKDGQTERNKQLAIYAPDNVISAQQFNVKNSASPVDGQTITAGPYISGVVSKSDDTAIYTVSAQVNNERWVYIDVPVFYDLEAHTFAISGAPSFVPAPEQAKLKMPVKPWNNDDQEAITEFRPDANLFFTAWAASQKDAMAVYADKDADTATKTGLNGAVKFKEISNISIQSLAEATDPGERKARVTVTWENAMVPGTTYSQSYDMTLVKKADEKHWKIKTLSGGIPLDSAS